jgi:hypothetical protein
MRLSFFGALPCLLVVQAAAQTPLTYAHLQAKARPAPAQGRAEALIAERQLQLQESRGFLREGPTFVLSAGPRRSPGIPGIPGTTDRGFELDLPLFLAPSVRAGLSASLGQAHPLLVAAARREDTFRLRAAYLDAWLASRMTALGQAELATVECWFQTAQTRFEAGADPAYQVALVESERLKVQQEFDEARVQEARAWGTLTALAELPATPVPLADPGPVTEFQPGEHRLRLQEGPLWKAVAAQADLEERSLRLKEAQALSRWSLRGSFVQEGEAKVTRLGLAVRLPRLGESAAIRRVTETQIRAVQGQARQTLAELEARAAGAVARLQPSPSAATLPDFTQAIAAVGLRLQEGRERPSEALPIRRQLLEGQKASLRRLHAQHLLAAELQTLMHEVQP